MMYALRHETVYTYANEVDVAAHYVHLFLQSSPYQRVISSAVVSEPVASRLTVAQDCFGNDAGWLFLDMPHSRFSLVLEARVEVMGQAFPNLGGSPAWEEVAAQALGPAGYVAAEFVYESPMVRFLGAMGEYTRESFTARRPAAEALFDLTLRMHKDFAFAAGVTDIMTPLVQVFSQKLGVCQDFSHLMIAGLREIGIPARYVSGYIRTHGPAGEREFVGADQSHAWVSAWMGAEQGWVDVDPTNGLIVAQDHVVLAYGRDYADISPICGVILGGGRHELRVSVDLTALG